MTKLKERLRQAIAALKDSRMASNPLRHFFNHDDLIAELEQEYMNLTLEIKNEPMSEPQFLQSLIHDLDPKDYDVDYESYLRTFEAAG